MAISFSNVNNPQNDVIWYSGGKTVRQLSTGNRIISCNMVLKCNCQLLNCFRKSFRHVMIRQSARASRRKIIVVFDNGSAFAISQPPEWVPYVVLNAHNVKLSPRIFCAPTIESSITEVVKLIETIGAKIGIILNHFVWQLLKSGFVGCWREDA